jgi:hypothetical protein
MIRIRVTSRQAVVQHPSFKTIGLAFGTKDQRPRDKHSDDLEPGKADQG